MKILHLPIKKKWFDMIASGEKKEEYREIKGYWSIRLLKDVSEGEQRAEYDFSFEQFDIVRIKNGYQKNAPVIDVEFKGIEIREGNPNWGAVEGEEYFVIKLGNILINKTL